MGIFSLRHIPYKRERERERDRQTERWKKRERERDRDRQTDREEEKKKNIYLYFLLLSFVFTISCKLNADESLSETVHSNVPVARGRLLWLCSLAGWWEEQFHRCVAFLRGRKQSFSPQHSISVPCLPLSCPLVTPFFSPACRFC